MAALDREAIAAVDSTGQLDEVLGLAEHLEDALWRFDSSGARPVDAAGGVIVAGHGRLGRGRAARDRRAGLAADAAAGGLRRLRAARLGGAVDARASPRATPATPRRRWRPTTTRSRAARRGSWPRRAAGWPSARARDGVPVVPIPGGFQPRAAIGYSLVGALEAAALGGAAPSVRARDRSGGRAGRVARARSGARTRAEDSLAKSLARVAARHRAGDRGRRARGRRGVPLEVPVQRERGAAGVRVACCPRPTTTRSSAGTRRASLGSFSYVSLEDPGAHPRNALRAELTADIAGAGASPVAARRGARRVAGRAARLARPARRPRLDLRRGPARRRPGRHRPLDGLKAALARVGEFSVPEDGCWPATVLGHVLHRLRARFRGRGRAQRRLHHRWRGAL